MDLFFLSGLSFLQSPDSRTAARTQNPLSTRMGSPSSSDSKKRCTEPSASTFLRTAKPTIHINVVWAGAGGVYEELRQTISQ